VRLRPRAQKRLLALVALTLGLMAASCGSTPTTPVTRITHLAPPSRPPARLRPAGTPVGVTQRVPAKGTTLVVTVRKVIDPLEGSGAKVRAGTVPVGVLIAVRNSGPGIYDSSYTSDFSMLIPGSRAIPVFVPSGVCRTYVQDFMNELGPGVARIGCIAYVVPRGEAPRAVRLAPDGGTTGHSVSWVVR
jgi:hypothetical protein